MTRITHFLLLALLGLSNAKQLNLRRQLQTAAPTDAATFDATEDATEGSTEGTTTDSPIEITEAPTEELSEASEAPTEGVTAEVTDAPMEVTDAPTEITEAPIVSDGPVGAGISCTTYTETMTIDLDVTFEGEAESCSAADEEAILNAVVTTLNEKFTEAVPDYEGTVVFKGGEEEVLEEKPIEEEADESTTAPTEEGTEAILYIEQPTASEAPTEEIEATGTEAPSEELSEDVTLAPTEGTSSEPSSRRLRGRQARRLETLETLTVEVEITDCAGTTHDSWSILNDVVVFALNTMEDRPSCLGTYPGLVADVEVVGEDAPVEEEIVEEPSVEEAIEETPAPTEEGTKEVLYIEAPVEESRNADILMTDGPNAFDIPTTVSVTYFEGQGGELEGEKLEDFTALLDQLEAHILTASAEFELGFAKYEARDVVQEWNDETKLLTLKFDSHVEFKEGVGEGETNHSVARVLARPDFKEFIHTLMDNGLGGIGQFKFTCTGHGERL